MTFRTVVVDEMEFDPIANGFRTQFHELDPIVPLDAGDTVRFRVMRGKTVARSCVCIVTHAEARGDEDHPYYIYSIRRDRDAK